MNPNKLLRFANMFYSWAAGEELPPNSDNLKTILTNLEKLETFAARKKYAEKNLTHLSSGSSRIVFLTSDKTVIKMAKNDRGLAQNKAEANPKMHSKYLNKVLGHASNFAWIKVPYLEKITEKDFEKMTGMKFDDFGEAVRYGLKDVSGNSDKEKPEHFDEISKSSIYKEVYRVAEDFKLMPGDLARISSWGVKGDSPVLIDAGLTKNVFSDYYEETST